MVNNLFFFSPSGSPLLSEYFIREDFEEFKLLGFWDIPQPSWKCAVGEGLRLLLNHHYSTKCGTTFQIQHSAAGSSTFYRGTVWVVVMQKALVGMRVTRLLYGCASEGIASSRDAVLCLPVQNAPLLLLSHESHCPQNVCWTLSWVETFLYVSTFQDTRRSFHTSLNRWHIHYSQCISSPALLLSPPSFLQRHHAQSHRTDVLGTTLAKRLGNKEWDSGNLLQGTWRKSLSFKKSHFFLFLILSLINRFLFTASTF